MSSPVAMAASRRATADRFRRRLTVVPIAALAAIVFFAGVVEAATLVVDDDPAARALAEERRFVRSIEAALPEGSDIFELPYPDRGGTGDLDGVTDGIADGATSRRASAAALAEHPVPVVAGAAIAAGFEGMYIDAGEHPDGGAAMAAELERVTGVTPRIGAGGRIVFFDLRPYGERLAAQSDVRRGSGAGRLILEPEGSEIGRAVYVRETDAKGSSRWVRREATVVLQPRRSTAAPLRVEYWLTTIVPETDDAKLRPRGGHRPPRLATERAVMRRDRGVDVTSVRHVASVAAAVDVEPRGIEWLLATHDTRLGGPAVADVVQARAPPSWWVPSW